MKVLVTGASGFVGGNLARMLWQEGYQVRALVRPRSTARTLDDTEIEQVSGDILDRESIDRAVRGCEAVFHCAAAYTFWSPDPGLIYETNVTGTVNVLDAAAAAGVSKTVYTSTVSTIGLTPGPQGGNSPAGCAPRILGNEDTPVLEHQLVGAYKKSKYQAEQVVLERASQGLPVGGGQPYGARGALGRQTHTHRKDGARLSQGPYPSLSFQRHELGGRGRRGGRPHTGLGEGKDGGTLHPWEREPYSKGRYLGHCRS